MRDGPMRDALVVARELGLRTPNFEQLELPELWDCWADRVALIDVLHRSGKDTSEAIADARRYEAVQKALDLLETTAMLEPNKLQDSTGQALDQPSPLAPAAPEPEPQTDPSPEASEGA